MSSIAPIWIYSSSTNLLRWRMRCIPAGWCRFHSPTVSTCGYAPKGRRPLLKRISPIRPATSRPVRRPSGHCSTSPHALILDRWKSPAWFAIPSIRTSCARPTPTPTRPCPCTPWDWRSISRSSTRRSKQFSRSAMCCRRCKRPETSSSSVSGASSCSTSCRIRHGLGISPMSTRPPWPRRRIARAA